MKAKEQLYQAVIHVFFIVIVCLCLLPFVLLIMTSFTDETAIVQEGYSFLPSKLSLEAYRFL